MRSVFDLTGKTFGRWTVISRAPSRGSDSMWNCKCSCGVDRPVLSPSLRRGASVSCGCFSREERAKKIKHGKSQTPEFRVWAAMRHRCLNKDFEQYHNYGGRGIKICDRWLDSFEGFLADVGARPSPKHSLDRYPDQSGNYEPNNVRWATDREQSNNRRTNRLVCVGGEQLSIAEAQRKTGISRMRIRTAISRNPQVDILEIVR